jgi:antitoxin (DNA-binding transcriptional repressor) of toxin-antitoxin stability system
MWEGELFMNTIPVEQAEGHLGEIIAKLPAGDEVVFTQDERPVATLRILPQTSEKPRRFGTLKGSILHIAADFDPIPEGFEEYLP